MRRALHGSGVRPLARAVTLAVLARLLGSPRERHPIAAYLRHRARSSLRRGRRDARRGESVHQRSCDSTARRLVGCWASTPRCGSPGHRGSAASDGPRRVDAVHGSARMTGCSASYAAGAAGFAGHGYDAWTCSACRRAWGACWHAWRGDLRVLRGHRITRWPARFQRRRDTPACTRPSTPLPDPARRAHTRLQTSG